MNLDRHRLTGDVHIYILITDLQYLNVTYLYYIQYNVLKDYNIFISYVSLLGVSVEVFILVGKFQCLMLKFCRHMSQHDMTFSLFFSGKYRDTTRHLQLHFAVPVVPALGIRYNSHIIFD